jgi:hypothetical protein
LQANRKTREGNQHMDRDAQFQYITSAEKLICSIPQASPPLQQSSW